MQNIDPEHVLASLAAVIMDRGTLVCWGGHCEHPQDLGRSLEHLFRIVLFQPIKVEIGPDWVQFFEGVRDYRVQEDILSDASRATLDFMREHAPSFFQYQRLVTVGASVVLRGFFWDRLAEAHFPRKRVLLTLLAKGLHRTRGADFLRFGIAAQYALSKIRCGVPVQSALRTELNRLLTALPRTMGLLGTRRDATMICDSTATAPAPASSAPVTYTLMPPPSGRAPFP